MGDCISQTVHKRVQYLKFHQFSTLLHSTLYVYVVPRYFLVEKVVSKSVTVVANILCLISDGNDIKGIEATSAKTNQAGEVTAILRFFILLF